MDAENACQIYEAINCIHLEVWREAYFRVYHPHRYRVRQCVKKFADCIDDTFHAMWYVIVYLFCFANYFLSFLISKISSNDIHTPKNALNHCASILDTALLYRPPERLTLPLLPPTQSKNDTNSPHLLKHSLMRKVTADRKKPSRHPVQAAPGGAQNQRHISDSQHRHLTFQKNRHQKKPPCGIHAQHKTRRQRKERKCLR